MYTLSEFVERASRVIDYLCKVKKLSIEVEYTDSYTSDIRFYVYTDLLRKHIRIAISIARNLDVVEAVSLSIIASLSSRKSLAIDYALQLATLVALPIVVLNIFGTRIPETLKIVLYALLGFGILDLVYSFAIKPLRSRTLRELMEIHRKALAVDGRYRGVYEGIAKLLREAIACRDPRGCAVVWRDSRYRTSTRSNSSKLVITIEKIAS